MKQIFSFLTCSLLASTTFVQAKNYDINNDLNTACPSLKIVKLNERHKLLKQKCTYEPSYEKEKDAIEKIRNILDQKLSKIENLLPRNIVGKEFVDRDETDISDAVLEYHTAFLQRKNGKGKHKFNPEKADLSTFQNRWRYVILRELSEWNLNFYHALPPEYDNFNDFIQNGSLELLKETYLEATKAKELKKKLASKPSFLTRTSSSTASPAITRKAEPDGTNLWKEIAMKKAERRDSGFTIDDEADRNRAANSKSVPEIRAQRAREERFARLTEALNITRFPADEQAKIKELLPNFIAAMEEEEKFSRSKEGLNKEQGIIDKCSGKEASVVLKILKKVGSNKNLVRLKEERLKEEAKEREAAQEREAKFAHRIFGYASHQYAFLSEIPEKVLTYLFNTDDNLTEVIFIDFLKKIALHDASHAFKEHEAQTLEAREMLRKLLNSKTETGVVILPTGKTFLSAFVKAQRNGKFAYFYYRELLKEDAPTYWHSVFKDNHTLIALDSADFVFAIPHTDPKGTIISLSTKQKLSGPQMNELYDTHQLLLKENSRLSIGNTGEILLNGKPLRKKVTDRGAALQGNVESITMSQGTLKLSGWSADIDKGKSSKSVTILYKNSEVGSIIVDQPRDLTYHFGSYGITGDYSKVGFAQTFEFPQSSDPDFDPSALKVIAIGEDNDANTLYVPQNGENTPSISVDGKILSEAGNIYEIKKTDRGDAIQGVVESFSIDQTQRKLFVSGWSSDLGKEKPSQSVAVFYKRKFVGLGQVDQPSPSISSHYAYYSIPGNYSQCGYSLSLDLPWWINDVNPNDIHVVSYGEGGDANFVYFDPKTAVVK